MYTSFDEKGKIHTNVVSKTPIVSIIQTTTHRIEGKVHVRPDDRLKDELSQSDCFLAITDATVYDVHGAIAFKTDFISVHRDHVVWLIPVEELKTSEGEA